MHTFQHEVQEFDESNLLTRKMKNVQIRHGGFGTVSGKQSNFVPT